MADATNISWSDATFNGWVGCTKVSPGCKNCYAETLVQGRMGRGNTWGPKGTRERTSASNWAKPHRWNRLAAEGLLPDGSPNVDGHRPRVFCASLADVFEDRPEVEPWRQDLFDMIAATPNLDWLLLTKRPDLAASWLRAWWDARRPMRMETRGGAGVWEADGRTWTTRDYLGWGVLPNLWIGTSIESTGYTWRADWLRLIPAAVRFISAEPLLGSLFTVPGEATDGYCAETDASRDVDELQPRHVGTAGSTPVLSIEDRAHDGTPGRAPAATSAQSGAAPGKPGAGPNGQSAPLDLIGIDWVICGGESGGRNARPMHPDWACEIRDAVLSAPCGRCAAGESVDDVFHVPRPALHFKQWGSWAPGLPEPGSYITYLSRDGRRSDRLEMLLPGPAVATMVYRGANPKSSGKLLDGVEWCEFPTPAAPLVPA